MKHNSTLVSFGLSFLFAFVCMWLWNDILIWEFERDTKREKKKLTKTTHRQWISCEQFYWSCKIAWLFVIAFYSTLKLLIVWARSRSFGLTPFCCWNKCNGIGWSARKNTFNVLVYDVSCFVQRSWVWVCACSLERVCIGSSAAAAAAATATATTIHRNVLHLYRVELFFRVELFVFSFLMHTQTNEHTLIHADLSLPLHRSHSHLYTFELLRVSHAVWYVCACVSPYRCIGVRVCVLQCE